METGVELGGQREARPLRATAGRSCAESPAAGPEPERR